MFAGFASIWTPVARSIDLGRKPLGLVVADQALVLFRDANGQPGALLARCPHRGADLSRGRVTPDGCLECPYHGWRFDLEGACTKVPGTPLTTAQLKRLAATRLPVREQGSLIWIFTDPETVPDSEPLVPSVCLDQRLYVRLGCFTWPVHWTHAMENALDPAHLGFVHARSFGGPLRRALMSSEARMRVSLDPLPTGWRMGWTVAGEPGNVSLEFIRPNRVDLLFPSEPRTRLVFWAFPAAAGETRLIVGSVGKRYTSWLRWLTDRMVAKVMREDGTVLTTCGQEEVPLPEHGKFVPSDRGSLAFRQYYYQVLRPSQASVSAKHAPGDDPTHGDGRLHRADPESRPTGVTWDH